MDAVQCGMTKKRRMRLLKEERLCKFYANALEAGARGTRMGCERITRAGMCDHAGFGSVMTVVIRRSRPVSLLQYWSRHA